MFDVSECARPKRRRDRGPSAFALRPGRFLSGSREPDHARGEPPVGGHPEARVPRSRPETSRTPPRPPGRSTDARRFAEFRSADRRSPLSVEGQQLYSRSWRNAPTWRFGWLDHQPRYAAFLTPSPSSPHSSYAHAKQFKRANRALKTIRTYLGRVMRDIVRKIGGDAELESVFAHPLMLGRRVREQRQHQRGRKSLPSGSVPRLYSLHAREVECIGKGKAHRPYEFGVKVSIATTLHRSAGGQFIAHAKALPGNPYDGHTLATMIPEIETQIGASLAHVVADRGYRGHNAPPGHKFKVYISGQRRRVTETIKRELRRRSAVEPVIGHAKAEHRMGRNYLAGTQGDAANAVLAAAGYNFRRLLEWLALLLSIILAALNLAAGQDQRLIPT